MNTVAYTDMADTYHHTHYPVERSGMILTDHVYSSRLLGRLAGTFGVQINQSDIHYWQTMLTAARALDDSVDRDHDTDSSSYVQALIQGHVIGGMTQHHADVIKDVYDALTPERQQRINRTSELGAFAIRRYEATDVHMYMHQTLAESHIFSEVLMIDTNRPDAVHRERFNHWLYSLNRTAYAFDSIVNLADDYAQGVTQIKPTLGSYTALIEIAASETKDCVSTAPFTMTPVLVSGLGLKKVLSNRQTYEG